MTKPVQTVNSDARPQASQAVALGRPEVEVALRAVGPLFAQRGWCFELVDVAQRFVTMRLDGNRSGGAVPWVLRDFERELRARLPGMSGVILVASGLTAAARVTAA